MRALVAGGIGALTLVGALFAYNIKKKRVTITRERALAIAKALRQEMYMVFVEISCFVRDNAQRASPEELRDFVLSEQSDYSKKMKQKISKVFCEISEEDFEQCITKDYKQDSEIQYHIKLYREELEKSLLGVSPQFREQVITFVSPEKILNIVEELLTAKIQRIEKEVPEKITVEEMEKILWRDQSETKALRLQKLKQIGFEGNEARVTSIFQFCVAKYLRMSEEFKEKYAEILKTYENRQNSLIDELCSFSDSHSQLVK